MFLINYNYNNNYIKYKLTLSSVKTVAPNLYGDLLNLQIVHRKWLLIYYSQYLNN